MLIRALLNNKEEIVSAIDAVEREFQEEREMLALAAPDELEETQLIQRAPLNISRRFQPYGSGGNFQEEQEQGVPINKVALGLGQDEEELPVTTTYWDKDEEFHLEEGEDYSSHFNINSS
ncbi:uncharacterized protein LOC121367136, partial [Gigantopelta aegis]|uniref:uncharacterized protein LOC121367136 n=1 Tax=Gigantopelta aegis TaxID=1735272 RepID=UPI001B88A412